MIATNHCIVVRQSPYGSAGLQVDPLLRSRRVLRRNGWRVEVIDPPAAARLEALRRRLSRGPVQALLLQVDWREPAQAVVELLHRIRGLPGFNQACRVVFLDHYDGITGPHLPVLPHVDAYVKKQLPRRLADLAVAPAAGGVIGQYLGELYDQPPQGAGAAEAETERAVFQYQSRLQLGWNVGAGAFISRLLFQTPLLWPLAGRQRSVPGFGQRTIDLHCRVGLGNHGSEDWYRRHRRAVIASLERLGGGCTKVLGMSGAGVSGGISPRQFRKELLNSRICVSPFGYGEICYRDYEAVAAGCLLAKPDMGHVRTEPDIFIPHETYIPIRWDLADLHEALEPYLADPRRAEAIAHNARTALIRYFRNQAWIWRLVNSLSTGRAPARWATPEPVGAYSGTVSGATMPA